ncbi:MAG: hypothetical protein IT208_02985 [Chthonomonadales bacterium]|nr:hypothetical protein [Chthonomonadales bacterium]
MTPKRRNLVTALIAACSMAFACAPAQASAPDPVPGAAAVRRVVMKDSLSAQEFQAQLERLQSQGLFRQRLPGDPKQPRYARLSFVATGNYVLVAGDRAWVDSEIENIRMMAFLFERPRAHLQLNLRVVQLTGPANTDVIQMTDTVRALVDTQRAQVVRAFADLQSYLLGRLSRRAGKDLAIYTEVRKLLPTLGKGERPLTVPEILLLLMIDRALPDLAPGPGETAAGAQAEDALEALTRAIGAAVQDPRSDDDATARSIGPRLADWKQAVAHARDWCAHYAEQLSEREGLGIAGFEQALQRDDCPLPTWVGVRLRRSLELTRRLYPALGQRQTVASLRELQRRFGTALERAEEVERDIGGYLKPATTDRQREEKQRRYRPGFAGRQLLALKAIADSLISVPLALFESVAAASDSAAPTLEQLVSMFRQYAEQRNRLDGRLEARDPAASEDINYARLEALEAALNLWLRRASDAMQRALEHQFYNRYVEELRLLANKQLARSSSREILAQSEIEDVPDVARDLLLADTGVNLFVSNSVSLQFAADTTNTVSAEVQAKLPSQSSLLERVRQASQAQDALSKLSKAYGFSGEAIVKALMAGGQAAPVQAGISLSARPSIGIDDSSVTLTLTAAQTLQPDSDKVTDRVTNHSIDNATISVLSYEPAVLSTLTSNVSYFENTGGIPVLRKVPGVKDLLADIPFAPFKVSKRQKGVYQSSVIILEPVVIPTIEDLVRYSSGWKA